MGSVAGMWAYPNGALYVTSKFAVHGFTRALREDLLGRPIRITNVAPGLVETDFSTRPLPRRRGEGERRLRERRPGRPGPPGGRRRVRPLRAHAAAERERRRDRRHRARAVLGSPNPPRGMSSMGLTILEGSTFCICDEIGDLDGRTSGLFAEDTRFLSRLELRIDGARPLLLSSGKVEYFSAAFYLRNPVVAGRLPQDVISIARERFVGDGMQDHLVVRNESAEPLAFEIGLEVGRGLRRHHHGQGARLRARPSRRRLARCRRRRRRASIRPRTSSCSRRPTNGGAKTQVLFSQPGVRRRLLRSLRARAGAARALGAARRRRPLAERRRGSRGTRSSIASARSATHVRESLSAWHLRVPRLRTASDDLRHSFTQSVADLAALRHAHGRRGSGCCPAAGMPWFMTVFGRDTLITSLQTMLLGPELATASLEALAALQAREDDPSIDAEPGKIVHELRRGRAAADVVPRLLRHRRRDAALPRPALRGVALDGRRRARRAAARRRRSRRSSGSTGTATATATASSSTSGGRRAASRTSPGRTPATRSASTTARFARAADRAGRGAGLRVDAKRAARRAGALGLGRRGARRPARARGGGAAAALRRAVLGRRARRLLRARTRRGQAARRRALLQHRPSALERDRAAGAGRRGRRAA